MPKGQYQRKPRAPKVEAPAPVHESIVPEGYETPVPMPVRQFEKVADQHYAMMPDGSFEQFEPVPDPEVERIAALLTQPVAPFPLPERTSETFDDWMEDEPAVIPADNRVTQMVGEWAALVCPIQHTVTWLPSGAGRELTVTLVTEHGTSNLHADAGGWNEADIATALAAMRVQLGV